MTATEICWMDAADLARDIRLRRLSPVEVTRAFIDRIEALNPTLNAFCIPMFEIAMDWARRAETAQMAGDFWGPLHGVPYAIKDSDDYAGQKTTLGSLVHKDRIATGFSPIIQRMEAAGAIPLGKTTTPDMAWIGLTYSQLYGETRNPWDLSRNPGGSSGGSAVAVATGMAPLATGTDGAGSVRIPASFCGIFGLKPSHGRIPLMLPNVNQHTHYGPLTRNVRDAALMMDVCAGPDPRDLYSLEGSSPGYQDHLDKPLTGKRIAWSADLGFVTRLDPEIRHICEMAALRFEDLGAIVEETRLDLGGVMEIAKRNWCAIMSALVLEVNGNHVDRFDPALVACARQAQAQSAGAFLHDKIRMFPLYQRLVDYFEMYDFILTPTVACKPLKNGRLVPEDYPQTDWDWMEWAPYSSPFNLFHNPAASVNAGFTQDGLPVGLQIVGPRLADLAVLQAAHGYERAVSPAFTPPPLARTGSLPGGEI
ncbi:aspartyl-tRNA(Asn)/glutamyl-tRNA(Gln) amidotransferase subunit A [Paracoccus isoporae]|uniref:Aspartyl-tRNA(Asn)/glutamyl-tRNA(Gln) amidotransferase subunit A n=1 Tax=Paracoccus isoporae TaxID=591205 RepID=A0A1G6ZMM2_9RHOB|nr:amidase family protein [Paracoccus isoporae]SDE02776.1 aspartyl-tRNA(Asn)/glutamyl-tRNA(Gln) amidotransferase subunit A [Paracoccus isoporae]